MVRTARRVETRPCRRRRGCPVPRAPEAAGRPACACWCCPTCTSSSRPTCRRRARSTWWCWPATSTTGWLRRVGAARVRAPPDRADRRNHEFWGDCHERALDAFREAARQLSIHFLEKRHGGAGRRALRRLHAVDRLPRVRGARTPAVDGRRRGDAGGGAADPRLPRDPRAARRRRTAVHTGRRGAAARRVAPRPVRRTGAGPGDATGSSRTSCRAGARCRPTSSSRSPTPRSSATSTRCSMRPTCGSTAIRTRRTAGAPDVAPSPATRAATRGRVAGRGVRERCLRPGPRAAGTLKFRADRAAVSVPRSPASRRAVRRPTARGMRSPDRGPAGWPSRQTGRPSVAGWRCG